MLNIIIPYGHVFEMDRWLVFRKTIFAGVLAERIALWLYVALLPCTLAAPYSLGVNVPTVSDCHKIILAGAGAGQFKSHDEFPNGPYPTGYQCRFVINAPGGDSIDATIGVGEVGMRPWDFAIIVDGRVASKLNFICDVKKYKELGENGVDYVAVVQKYLAEGMTRVLKSNTTTIVVDFCVHTFSKDLEDRKGFEVYYSSTPSKVYVHGAQDSPGRHEDEQIEGQSAAGGKKNLCGRPQNPPSNNPNRIVNGVLARENSWPWICSLVQKPTLQFCGCTLIADQWIATAGHCVDNASEDHLKRNVIVYLGVENLLQATDSNRFAIKQVIKHELYNVPPGSTANDIALIKIDRPAHYSNDIMPACLPTKSVHEKPYVQTGSNGRRVCWVAGWGKLYEGQSYADGGSIGAGSDNLRQVAIEVMSDKDCKAYMKGYTITPKMFCGGYDHGRYDSCQGDSGGPLMCDDGTGRWNLYGVVSWGLGCAEAKAPGIYTNVALMRDWIDSKIIPK